MPSTIISGLRSREALTFDLCVNKLTKPEPEKRLASEARIPAPPIPSDPATIKTLPLLPLCELISLLGSLLSKLSKLNFRAIDLFFYKIAYSI